MKKKRRSEEAPAPSTWPEIFEHVARHGEVVLRRGNRLYALRGLNGTPRRRGPVLIVPAAGGRRLRAFADSPVAQRGFGWRFDPAGGGLRLVKPDRRAGR
jgi:hypothetical protein